MSSRIVINGRFLTQSPTGVQRFAFEITRRLAKIRDVLVVVPRSELRAAPDFEVLPIGRTTGHLWEQVELPMALGRMGSPLLLGLASTGPAFYRNQAVTHHDITYIRHPESFSRGFRAVYRVLMPTTLRSARRVITVSQFSRREIAEWYGVDPAKIVVVNNAVCPSFVPSDAPKDRYVLAVSSPNRHKNFERLVEATRATGVPLKIVGSQAKAFTESVSAESALVDWMGRVEDAELVALLQRARAFVFPSLYEGFGIPPLEAQACGCPVVAADIPPVREVLGASAEYFDPTSVDGMAGAIARVFTDRERADQLREDGSRNVSRFSWDDSARTVSSLLDELAAGGDRNRR